MATVNGRRARLSIEVEPELCQRIKVAAAQRDLSVRDYVMAILRRALDDEEVAGLPDATWEQLSGSFARDWDSEADRVYDQLS